jgi:acylphosphatase
VAGGFEVTGWVRNEPDGSVRCVAEGEQAELQRFVRGVQDAMDGYIRDTRIQELAAEGDLDGFVIRY